MEREKNTEKYRDTDRERNRETQRLREKEREKESVLLSVTSLSKTSQQPDPGLANARRQTPYLGLLHCCSRSNSWPSVPVCPGALEQNKTRNRTAMTGTCTPIWNASFASSGLTTASHS